MDLPTILKGLQQLVESAPILFANRYLNAVSLGILLYDHVLTFGDEVRYMWDLRRSQESWFSRLNYFVTRYTTEAIFIFVAYVTSGVNNMDEDLCKRYVWMLVMVATVFLVSLQVTVVLRMYNLWDRRKAIIFFLGGAFALLSVTAVGIAVFTAREAARTMTYIPFVRSCGSSDISSNSLISKLMRALLGTMSLFDLVILTLAFLNALDVPTQSNEDLAYLLQRDGTRIFFVVFVLRLAALIVVLSTKTEVGYIILPVIWSLVSVSNSRITLRVAETTYQRSKESLEDLSMDELPSTQQRENSLNLQPITPKRQESWGNSSLGHTATYGGKEGTYWE